MDVGLRGKYSGTVNRLGAHQNLKDNWSFFSGSAEFEVLGL